MVVIVVEISLCNSARAIFLMVIYRAADYAYPD